MMNEVEKREGDRQRFPGGMRSHDDFEVIARSGASASSANCAKIVR
jgi:hypothetical protein